MSYTRNAYIDVFVAAMGMDPTDVFATTQFLHGKPLSNHGLTVSGHQMYMTWMTEIDKTLASLGIEASETGIAGFSSSPSGMTICEKTITGVIAQYADNTINPHGYQELK